MPTDRFILALDQGTSSSRALIFDRAGQVVAAAQREFTQYYPQAGWVEHDAEEIWTSQLAVAREALGRAGIGPAQVAAVGIANQRETTVLWERASGRPLAPAIVWQDRRTAEQCARLLETDRAELVSDRTGLVIDPYFAATKLAWLLDHIPGARARAVAGELAFGTIDSWLVWRLSGGRRHATDVSNAARTMLFDIRRLAWDDDLLDCFDIPRALLPEVVPSSGPVALCDAACFGAALPITGIAGDQQAATFGQACLAPGMAKNTYGTGLFLLMNTDAAPTVSRNRLISTVAWDLGAAGTGPAYALEGSVFMGGATIQWLRDGLRIIDSAPEVGPLAAECADSGGVVMVPAFAGLGAPYWDPFARGALLGMTRGTGRAHIARAALEAIALQSVDVLQAMQRDAGMPVSELRVDGGASRCDLLMQLQADLLGEAVVRPHVTETTALGAAYLAGIGVGFWGSAAEVAAQWRAERRFEPAIGEDQRQARRHRWHDAVARTRAWQRETGQAGGAVT